MSAGGPPRVVHITTVHHPRDPRIFYKQLATLRDAGYDVHFVAPWASSGTVEGISVTGLPSLAGDQAAGYGRRLRAQPRMFRRARKLQAALYHVHDPELLPIAYLLRQATGARVVYDMHEDYASQGGLRGGGLRCLERWAFRWLDHVVLAEPTYRPVVDDAPVGATLIANYAHPPPSQGGGALPCDAGPTRLLYTGTAAVERGLDTMLDLMDRAYADGRPEQLRLVGVCHRSDERTRARQRLDGLPAARWVGNGRYVDADAMWPHYRWADVGLALCKPTPNLRRSIPTKFFEYLQYGLPILCTDIPRWRDFVERHNCGAVVPAGAPDAVLDVLRRWREQPRQFRKCAENARRAAPQYRWERMEERLLDVYEQVLAT